MACTGVYVVSHGDAESAHADHALRALRAACDRLIVVTSANSAVEWIAGYEPDEVRVDPDAETSYLAGLRNALLAVLDRDPAPATPILVTGAHVLGPIGPIAAHIDRLKTEGATLFAPYWHNTEADPRTQGGRLPERIPYLDFAIFMPDLLGAPGFRALWEAFSGTDFWSDLMLGGVGLARYMEREGHRCLYALSEDQLKTSEPRLFEVHTLVEQGAPCIPLAVLTIDPLIHDLNAIALKRALDALRQREPALYKAAISYCTRNVRMREFNAISDQYEVIPLSARHPQKTEWSFGTVAVFIHAYYPDMIAELAGIASHVPAPVHLFVTTASDKDREQVEAYLRQQGFADDAVEVRVVDQNRGRDMSSLFITFRDVILGGKFDIALRLHSKRTPQVTHRVAQSFKAHLFENLVQGRGYVSNLLDRLEAEPDIGLVIPPVVHIGFGTLGHSWFNNFNLVSSLVEKLGLKVPLDTATPVAAYGTMFWFRTDALRKMFDWRWRWDDYNEEPQHFDGGLAHAQERLIGYCVQDRGYRVLSVMTPEAAARNYAKLEYKMQRLVSHLSPANIIDQDRVMAHSRLSFRARLYQSLMRLYGKILIRWPASRRHLRPIAKVVSQLLMSGPRP